MAKLGTGRITLADLTDERPAKMDLATSLETLQSQTGTAYSPDYSLGDGQVIIPSVFFGNEELASGEYRDKIVYNCSDLGDKVDFKYGGAVDDNGNKYESTETINGYKTYKSTYVDDEGCLHICRNLDKSFVVEARIENITDTKTGVTQLSISEAITLKKISAGTGYQLFIESQDNRWDFEVGGEADIILTYKVYYDTDEVTNNVVATQWYESGEEIKEDEITEKNESYTVKRSNVFGHETYRLAVKMDNGIILRASVGIDDRTDSFYGEIISYGATYLSPKNNSLKLECQVWRNDSQFEFETENENNCITYEWYCLDKEAEGMKGRAARLASLGNTKELTLTYESINGKDAMVYCRATVTKDGKKVGYPLAKISVNCGENFNAELSRSVVSLACYSSGDVKNSNFSETVTLTLKDDSGNLLQYDNENDEYAAPPTDDNFKFSIEGPDSGEDWIVSLTLTKGEKFSTEWDAKTYSITYKRNNATYVIPFEVIKVKQGENGTPGFTIDLTNQFHLFAGTDFGAYSNQKVEVSFTAMLADTDISKDLIRLETIDKNNSRKVLFGSDTSMLIEAATGVYVSYSNSNKTITIRTKQESGENTYTSPDRGEIMFYFVFQNGTTIATEKTFIKTFTYGINTTGNSFSLITDPTQVIYLPATNELNVNAITVSAQYQLGGKGSYSAYPNAKVYYTKNGAALPDSVDERSSISLNETGQGTLSSLSTTDTSYTFYYYIDDKTLVDIETVPIVTSMDGVEIGGENLFYYSGTLLKAEKEEEIGWKSDNSLEYDILEDSSSYKKVAFPSSVSTLTSPLVKYNERYTGSLCFSFSIKNTEEDYSFSTAIIYSESQQVLSNPRYKENFVSGVENRCYYVFSLEKQEDFSVIISAKNIQFYKPKLELGNIPTEWTANFYDNEKVLSQLTEDTNASISKVKEELLEGIAKTSTVVKGQGELSFITDTLDTESSGELENFVFTITDTEKNTYNIVGYEAFQEYIKELNERNAKNIKAYSSTLINNKMGELSEYTNSIVISPAHVDDTTGEIKEGTISIQTSYLNGDKKLYKEALSITSNRIGFNVDEQEVAYMSNEQFYIKKGQITGTLILGPEGEGKHLKIYTADDSVAVVWE